jgi:DNA-binding transcriptional LysR family regulator
MQVNLQNTIETIAAEREELRGRVYIGMPGSVGNVLRDYLLSANHEIMESIQLGIILNPDKHIFNMLRDNLIDIGFTTTPISSKNFYCSQVFKEEIALITASDHAPINNLKELENSKFVMHPGFDEYWKHWFGEVFPNVPYYYPEKISAFMNNFENILHSVAEGFGVTVLPIRNNMEFLKNKKIIKSTPHKKVVEQSVFLVYKPTASFAAKTIGKMCISYLNNTVQSDNK